MSRPDGLDVRDLLSLLAPGGGPIPPPVTPGGGFLPSGGPLGIGPSVVNQAAYVDPIHPLAADDADLSTPFLTPQGGIDALAAVVADAGGGTLLVAAGNYSALPDPVFPSDRFWTIVPVGGFVRFPNASPSRCFCRLPSPKLTPRLPF